MGSRTILSDRFIPCQSSSNFDLFHASPATSGNYNAMLRSALFGPGSTGSNIFKFKTETKKPLESLYPFELEDDNISPSSVNKASRKIRKTPSQILDAPQLEDDYYTDLVDWSRHNVLAVGLKSCVYTQTKRGSTAKVEKVCELAGDGETVCSVSWGWNNSDHLAVGTSSGEVQIWDVSRSKKIRSLYGHSSGIPTLAWSSTGSTLSSGSYDRTILDRDVRTPYDSLRKLTGHKGTVSGLRWSPDGEKLASGGNDDHLFVWNRRSTKPMIKYTEHTASVRAIAWSPHQNGLLASGGGTHDRTIRFWDTNVDRVQGTSLSSTDTGSQVCKLAWSNNVNEIVSTHGYCSNKINVWEYPKMTKVATLEGHTSRVLHLAVSPDGSQIVTGAGDETIRFWNVFPKAARPRKPEKGIEVMSFGMRSHIR